MIRKIIIHAVCYLLVAAGSFWAGAVTRDYLVKRDARLARERPLLFLDKPAPDILSTTLEGQQWMLSAYRGKVVLIDVWAPECPSYRNELSELKRVHDKFSASADFLMVGFAVDGNLERVREFCAANQVPWTQVAEAGHDFDSSFAKAFQIDGVPQVIVIDRSGVVRRYRDRSTRSYAVPMDVLINKLLAEPGA